MRIEKVSENECRLTEDTMTLWIMIVIINMACLSMIIGVPIFMVQGNMLPSENPVAFGFLMGMVLIMSIAFYSYNRRYFASFPKTLVKADVGTLEIKGKSYQLGDLSKIEVCYQRVRFGKSGVNSDRIRVSSNYHLGLRINDKFIPLAFSLSQNDANHIAEVLSGFLKVPVTQTSKLFGPL